MNAEQPLQQTQYDADPLATIADVSVTGDLIDVLMPNGKVWGFSTLRNPQARRELVKDTDAFVKRAIAEGPEGLSLRQGWRDKGYRIPKVGGGDESASEDFRIVYQVHRRSERPSLSIDDAMGLLAAPETLAYLDQVLEIGDKSVMTMLRAKAKEEMEKKSETIPGTDDDSPSAPESSEGEANSNPASTPS